jgi:hypothetical protein
MTKLPRISGRECVSALLKLGFYVKGSMGAISFFAVTIRLRKQWFQIIPS